MNTSQARDEAVFAARSCVVDQDVQLNFAESRDYDGSTTITYNSHWSSIPLSLAGPRCLELETSSKREGCA